jgi:hypothetical protein
LCADRDMRRAIKALARVLILRYFFRWFMFNSNACCIPFQQQQPHQPPAGGAWGAPGFAARKFMVFSLKLNLRMQSPMVAILRKLPVLNTAADRSSPTHRARDSASF